MKPWVSAIAIALLTVAASGFTITSPPAYGFCVACHTRDLLTGTAPLLTGAGLLIGGYLGALQGREFRPHRLVQPMKQFGLGFVAMFASLVALGCTVRLLLRASYGDGGAWWAVLGVAGGIALGTHMLRRRARRGLP
ncbi:MAG TPA: hypothetical protein VD969_00090 [Symbiobacteriaceae bacterium]|nr:hypothetical protein [Symbiobacteriaceae bacterium]